MSSYLVTGASRGIGLEFVKQLSANADNTVFALVRNYGGADLLHPLVEAGTNIHVVETDINNIPGLEAAAKKVEEVMGERGLDYLINNAAYPSERNPQLITDYSDQGLIDEVLEITRVNVGGVALVIKKFLPLLKKGTAKKVITLGSGVGDHQFVKLSGMITFPAYAIAESAVVMVNQLYATQFKDFIFLCISPGVVATDALPVDPATLKGMIAFFRQFAPDFQGPITPTESVQMMLGVIDNLRPEDSGSFISHKGNNKEWV